MLKLKSNNHNRILASKDKQFFENIYLHDGMSAYKIAKIFDVTPQCIYLYLKRHNIKIKSFSEVHKGRTSGFKGKQHSEEAKLKNKLTHIKSNHLERKDYYPSVFYKLRGRIKERDNYTCQNCGMNENDHFKIMEFGLNIHHINYNKENCNERNLITVCHSCNSKANKDRDYWFAFYTYKMEEIKWL